MPSPRNPLDCHSGGSLTVQSRVSTDNLTVFYSEAYGAAADPFDTLHKGRWTVESLRQCPIPGVVLAMPVPLTAEQMALVHDPAYLNALQTGEPRSLAESSGLEWDAGMWTSLTASNGGVVAAALRALTTRQNAGSLSAGIHHARAGTGVALCAVNGLALAARATIDADAKRVLIIDVDAHCGGGTDSIVRAWPEVVQLDIAVSTLDAYEPTRPSTLDIVETAPDYLPTLRRRLDALNPADFDVLILGAGVDAHEANGGLEGIDYRLLAEREATVFSWAAGKVPVAFCLLGGYLGRDIEQEDLARLHRLTLAAAARVNRQQDLSVEGLMEDASTQRGTEGFAWSPTGRKLDAGFHEDLLGPEEDDPFMLDLDKFAEMSPDEQTQFLAKRHEHPGRRTDFGTRTSRPDEG